MKNVLEAIRQASKIQTECNRRARQIREQITKIERKKFTRNPHIRIWRINEKWNLEQREKRLIERGQNVWLSVTSYQGKYINWKDIHEVNGKTYCGIFELIQGARELN